MLLECELIKVSIVKSSKFVSQPTERANQADSTSNYINCKTKLQFTCKRENVLRLALCVTERLPCC